MTVYRLQGPVDTMEEKIGTYSDTVFIDESDSRRKQAMASAYRGEAIDATPF